MVRSKAVILFAGLYFQMFSSNYVIGGSGYLTFTFDGLCDSSPISAEMFV